VKNTIDINSLISVLSLIISVGSLFINYLVYKFYTPKLIFKLIPHSYYFYMKDLKSNEYDSEKAAVISLKISNSSSFPITIDEVYIKNHTKIFHNNGFTFAPIEIKLENNKFTYLPPKTIAKIPLRIEPYDTVQISFRFPFFKGSDNFKLFLSTPRKNYSLRVKLLEYHELYHSLF